MDLDTDIRNTDIKITVPGSFVFEVNHTIGDFYLDEIKVAYDFYGIDLINEKYEIVKYIPGLRERGDGVTVLPSTKIDGYQLILRKKK